MDPSSQRKKDESRLYRECNPANQARASATLYSAERGHVADYGEPEADYYVDRDHWYTQSQPGRPCSGTVWGH